MLTEIKILMEQNTKQDEKLQNITNQLDADRSDINNLRIDQSTIKTQQQVIIDTMVDFKNEIRQMVIDTIKEEVQPAVRKAIKTEIRLLSRTYPKRVIERQVGIWESIKKLLKIK